MTVSIQRKIEVAERKVWKDISLQIHSPSSQEVVVLLELGKGGPMGKWLFSIE